MLKSDTSATAFDVAVIGAGVVGCAVTRALTLQGYRTVLLEKAPDILSGASKGNSALLHTGFDAPFDSLELRCMQAGYLEYLEIHECFNLPLLRTGAMVVAWTEEDAAQLRAMADKAIANGVTDVSVLTALETAAREPHLSASHGALLVPGEYVIDPWSAPLAYLTQAVAMGARFARSTTVLGGQRLGNRWRLSTNQGDFLADQVVNCAGLYGDHVEALLLGKSHFTIKPRKGQFVVYDKPASKLLRHIVLQVPTERTKGIVVTRTIFGNVLVGPTAEEQDSRDDASVDQATLENLKDQAERMIPGLVGMPVNAVYAGIRPASDRKEYRVRHEVSQGYIAVGGIRSTGLTSALGLAKHVTLLLNGACAGASGEVASASVDWPRLPNLAEHLPRAWSQPGHGEIVCHCELVTKQEIEGALSSLIPAIEITGLKRRTRACMGRCQGFYCGAEVARITAPYFEPPMAEPKDAQ